MPIWLVVAAVAVAVVAETLSRTPAKGEALESPSPAVLTSDLPLVTQVVSTVLMSESSSEIRARHSA
jgi:hypothetical protein